MSPKETRKQQPFYFKWHWYLIKITITILLLYLFSLFEDKLDNKLVFYFLKTQYRRILELFLLFCVRVWRYKGLSFISLSLLKLSSSSSWARTISLIYLVDSDLFFMAYWINKRYRWCIVLNRHRYLSINISLSLCFSLETQLKFKIVTIMSFSDLYILFYSLRLLLPRRTFLAFFFFFFSALYLALFRLKF
jgi:hypothetical protein